MAFAAAAARGMPSTDLDRSREALGRVVGQAGVTEAAATVAVFNGLVRIADGTGIQLDPNLAVASEASRERLDINRFAGAANSEGARRGSSNPDSIKALFE